MLPPGSTSWLSFMRMPCHRGASRGARWTAVAGVGRAIRLLHAPPGVQGVPRQAHGHRLAPPRCPRAAPRAGALRDRDAQPWRRPGRRVLVPRPPSPGRPRDPRVARRIAPGRAGGAAPWRRCHPPDLGGTRVGARGGGRVHPLPPTPWWRGDLQGLRQAQDGRTRRSLPVPLRCPRGRGRDRRTCSGN